MIEKNASVSSFEYASCRTDDQHLLPWLNLARVAKTLEGGDSGVGDSHSLLEGCDVGGSGIGWISSGHFRKYRPKLSP